MTKRVVEKRVRPSRTPVREALLSESSLRPLVKDGLGAVLHAHRDYFDKSIRSSLADSLDIDDGLKKGREQEHRWDYLLGHEPSQRIFAVEPHSADNSEIGTVIKKRQAALYQLQEHLREGKLVAKWLWVASGRVRFLALDKANLQLAQNGIEFVGGKITGRHVG